MYMCIAIPSWNDEDGEISPEAAGVGLQGKPASEHPDWKWVVMHETWMIVTEWHRRTDYCNPDNFDMYIYNDWFGYGLQELQENLVSPTELAIQYSERLTEFLKSLSSSTRNIARSRSPWKPCGQSSQACYTGD
jgi:hypothetical protein